MYFMLCWFSTLVKIQIELFSRCNVVSLNAKSLFFGFISHAQPRGHPPRVFKTEMYEITKRATKMSMWFNCGVTFGQDNFFQRKISQLWGILQIEQKPQLLNLQRRTSFYRDNDVKFPLLEQFCLKVVVYSLSVAAVYFRPNRYFIPLSRMEKRNLFTICVSSWQPCWESAYDRGGQTYCSKDPIFLLVPSEGPVFKNYIFFINYVIFFNIFNFQFLIYFLFYYSNLVYFISRMVFYGMFHMFHIAIFYCIHVCMVHTRAEKICSGLHMAPREVTWPSLADDIFVKSIACYA